MSERAPLSVDLLEEVRSLVERGDFVAVVRRLEALPRADVQREPELGYHLAYALRREGRTREALALAVELDVPARRSAVDWLVRRRVNLEAMLRYDLGELVAAEHLWQEVVELASRADDQQLLAGAHNNLGVVHTLQDRMQAAFAAYQRALLASRALGDRRGMAQAHQNLGILNREIGRVADADGHFEQALREAREAGSEDVRGRAEEERALLQLEAGDSTLAAATAARAVERLTAIRDAVGRGEALRVLGIIALKDRRLDDAGRRLDEALEVSREVGNPLLEAETLEALALLAELEGERGRAEELRSAAEDGFGRMRAANWGRRIRLRTSALAQ